MTANTCWFLVLTRNLKDSLESLKQRPQVKLPNCRGIMGRLGRLGFLLEIRYLQLLLKMEQSVCGTSKRDPFLKDWKGTLVLLHVWTSRIVGGTSLVEMKMED